MPLWATVDVTLIGRGLKPGDAYEATFAAYASEDDPYPYMLGVNAQNVRLNGTVKFVVGLDELTSYKKKLVEIKMWLRPPGSPVNAPPSNDAQGQPLETEYEAY